MNIDSLMNPTQATSAQVAAAFSATAAIAEAIRTLGEVPNGHLYANVCGHMELGTYDKIIQTLKNTGLVSESAHLLTWIGPKLEAK